MRSRNSDLDRTRQLPARCVRTCFQPSRARSRFQVLSEETARLNDAVAAAQSSGAKQDADVALLALNSLARLHASHADPEEEEEEADSDGPHTDECVVGSAGPGVEEDEGEEEDEDEDDDDDDPFFMPMPGAIKWAEASKFKELARPLAPEQPADKQFMIVMEDGGWGLGGVWRVACGLRAWKWEVGHGAVLGG